MKLYLIAVVLTLSTTLTSVAQTEKGSKLIGVQVGNLTFPTSGGGGSIISLQPAVGWFVVDRLAIGAGVPFFTVGAGGDIRSTQIGIAPFARYYFGQTTVKPYVNASVGIMNTSIKFSPPFGGSSQSESSTDGFYGVGAGVAFFINRSVSFDVGLTYTGGNTVAISNLFGNASGLTPTIPQSININLGFQVFLGKK